MYTLFNKLTYTISPQVLTNIGYINQLRGQLVGLGMSEAQKETMQQTKIIEISHYSTKIEGNNISFPLSQAYIHDHTPIPASAKDKRELMNTYSLIQSYTTKPLAIQTLSVSHLHLFHTQIMQELVPDDWIGQRRNQQNVVRAGSLIVYMPPEAKDVAKLMNELIQWIQDNHTQIDPIILACIVHHSILLIHPYIDGNGRLSRFVQLLILWNKGFGTYKIYSLDTECEKHLQAYYDAIMIGHNRYTVNTVDGTGFVEYMTLMMVYALEKAVADASNINI